MGFNNISFCTLAILTKPLDHKFKYRFILFQYCVPHSKKVTDGDMNYDFVVSNCHNLLVVNIINFLTNVIQSTLL